MNKEERVLKTINREEIDYLPSQITFSDRTRLSKIGKLMGFPQTEDFEDYLQNHIYFTYTTNNQPLFNRNDEKLMKKIEEMGFVRVDWEKGVVYDEWGVGIEMYSDGIFPVYHPLQSGKDIDKRFIEKFLPDELKGGLGSKSVEAAIKEYKTPDPDREGNFHFMKKDLAEHSGDFLVLTSGYGGIYERAYFLTGYEEFMTLLASDPVLLSGLLEKITDYKVRIAENVINLGFKAGHTGDDLGSQYGPMISLDMFRKYLKPHIKRLWSVFKDAGIPVIFHSCGDITQFLPDLIEIGLDVLEPVQPVMDLAYIKKEFGKDITFWGGIDTQMLLPYGTPEEVRKMASESIRALGKGGGHIIAPAQEIMKDVPTDNVQALVETIISERQTVL
jgi:uroporphyrinogen decarboxylase